VAGAAGGAVGAVPAFGVLASPVPGLVAAFGVAFGAVGVASVVAGRLAFALATGHSLSLIGPSLLGAALLGVVVTVLWHGAPAPDQDGPLSGPVPWRVARSVSALTAGAVAGGAATAWALEALGRGPFYLAPRYALSLWVSSVALAPPAVYLYGRLARVRSGDRQRVLLPTDAWAWSPTLVALPFVWGVVGVVGSVGYRAVNVLLTADPAAFTGRGLGFLLALHGDAIYGPGGRRVQVAFGGLMLTLIALALIRARTAGAPDGRELGPRAGAEPRRESR